MEPNTSDGEARRLRKPGWKDPRLLVGILLMVASVAGVVALISSLDKSVAMYIAKEDISLGEKVEASRLSVVEVRLDGTAARYAVVGGIPEGSQANTLIRAGELVPMRALGVPDATGRKPVTIELQQALTQAVVVGTRVDIWSGAKTAATNSYEQPELLLPGAEVSALRPMETGFGGTAGIVVEVLVEDGKLSQLLNALANEARITVVHNPSGGTP